MNAHQTIGMVSRVAKMPAGAPPTRLAIRIAGKKPAKQNLAPNSANNSCIVVANATASSAAMNVDNDHGRSISM